MYAFCIWDAFIHLMEYNIHTEDVLQVLNIGDLSSIREGLKKTSETLEEVLRKAEPAINSENPRDSEGNPDLCRLDMLIMTGKLLREVSGAVRTAYYEIADIEKLMDDYNGVSRKAK